MLAAAELIQHIKDHPWYQTEVLGIRVTLMSSAIAAMILTALLLPVLIVPAANRRRRLPAGGQNALEAMVLFVRDMIARPALHGKAYDFLPFLLTLFVFILGMNLVGLLPLPAVSQLLHLPKIGGAATGILTVTGALASVTLLTIIFLGLRHQALHCHEHKHWPLWLCAILSPALWMKSLSPRIPGPVGYALLLPLMLLELVGVFAKCAALMIRLFANILAGHTLAAALLMFVAMAVSAYVREQSLHVFYVAPLCVIGSVLATILDLLVAFLQAYIFTFLTAMFLGLYVEPSH